MGSSKFLTFNLDNEIYGLPILRVQEIIGMMKVTKFPNSSDYIRGVINLRGKVIPVIDLRIRFGIPGIETTDKTCIIVLSLIKNNMETQHGIVVDEVSEVIDINDDKIENSPVNGKDSQDDFITSVGKVGEKVVIMLDVDKILNEIEIIDVTKENII